MNNNKFFNNDKLLIYVVIYGLLALFAILLVAHYIAKQQDHSALANSTEKYMNSKNIDGEQKTLVLNATKEKEFKNSEDEVTYHTKQLQAKSTLSMELQKIITLHLDLIKKPNDDTTIKDADKEISNIKSRFQSTLDTFGQTVPPLSMSEQHDEFLTNVAEAIVELDAYQKDVDNKKINGPSDNPHIDKIKRLFSKM